MKNNKGARYEMNRDSYKWVRDYEKTKAAQDFAIKASFVLLAVVELILYLRCCAS